MKLIKIEQYLLWVDENENTLDVNDWTIDVGYSIKPFRLSGLPHEDYAKVIAHLPLNNSPYLDGVLVLPAVEEEIKLPYQFGEKLTSHQKGRMVGYKEGYKAASQNKWTDEDMIAFAKRCMVIANDEDGIGRPVKFIENQLKTFIPNYTSIEFVAAMEYIDTIGCEDQYTYQIIHLPDGRQQIVGHYIF